MKVGIVEPQRIGKIASFIGRTEAVSGDIAYVTILDKLTGERFKAECENELLRRRGIEQGSEFLCTVSRHKNGQVIIEFSPLPPKVLNEGQLDDISKETDSRLY